MDRADPFIWSSDAIGDNIERVGRLIGEKTIANAFIENKGQFPPDLRFVSETSFGRIGIGNGSIFYQIRESPGDPTYQTSHVIRIDMVGINPVEPVGHSSFRTSYNYFLENDASSGIREVNSYSSVIFSDLWDGIDLVYRTQQGRIKYDLIIKPGANPSEVRFDVQGIDRLDVADDSLVMVLNERLSLADSALMSYQKDDGQRVDVAFTIEGSVFGFELGAYDPGRTVIIDPEIKMNALNFSTYVGGSGYDEPSGLAIGPDGDVFVCGYTQADDFPTTPGTYQTNKTKNWATAFVFRLTADGSNLTYCTFLGGSNGSFASDISVDPSGSAFVCGYTDSIDFPLTEGAYDDKVSGMYDCFILRLSANGSSIIHSTLFGGERVEGGPEMDVDDEGNVYMILTTDSTDFPVTTNAHQPTMTANANSGTRDLALFVIDLKNMRPIYSTYMGGTDWEFPTDLRCGQDSIVYIGGYTCSKDFNVTADAYMSKIGGDFDGFLFSMNASKGDLVFSTFFGGSGFDAIYGIDILGSDRIFACGMTESSDLPMIDGCFDDEYNGKGDAFVIELNASGSTLVYSTFIGGSDGDSFVSIDVDLQGEVHLTGDTRSVDYPVIPEVLQTVFGGGQDALYAKFSSNFTALAYSTYLGGSGYENMNIKGRIVLDHGSGDPVLMGVTSSSDFPTTDGSFDTSYDLMSSGSEVFVSKINVECPPGMPLIRSVTCGDSFVNLGWELPEGNFSLPVKEFEVFRGRISGRLEPIGTSGLNMSYNDTMVKNGFMYYYAVRGRNDVGSGLISLEVTARPGARPSTPLNLSAQYGDSKIDLRWDAPKDDGGFRISSYRIQRTWEMNDTYWTIYFNPSMELYEDRDVKNGVEYNYSVTAVNDIGISDPSDIITVRPRTIPSAPKALIAITGPDHALLGWEEPQSNGGSDILGYKIYRYDVEWDIIDSVGGGIREYNDTGLTVKGSYMYKLTAFNTEGESDPSDVVEALIVDRPSVPLNFEVTASDRSVILRWDAPLSDGGSSLLGYWVYRVEGLNSTAMALSRYQTTFTDREVMNGRSYTYSISAYNRLGQSRMTDPISVNPAGRPSPPSGLVGISGDGFIHLSWDMPYDGGSHITSFRILRENGSSMMVNHANTTGNTFEDTGLINGMTYSYHIRSVNAIGESSLSERITLTPQGLPDPPRSLVARVSDCRIELSWNDTDRDGGSPIIHYRIFRTVDGLDASLLAETGSDVNEFTDKDLINGIEYEYAIRSVTVIGVSVLSESVCAIPSTVPGVPGSLVATFENGTVVLKWTTPVDDGGSQIIGYRIHKCVKGGYPQPVAETGPEEREFMDMGVAEGTVYCFIIKAFNENGEGEGSTEVEITIKHIPNDGGGEEPTPTIINQKTGIWTYFIVAGTILISLMIGVLVFLFMRSRHKGHSMTIELTSE